MNDVYTSFSHHIKDRDSIKRMQINDKIEIRNGRLKVTDIFYFIGLGFFFIMGFFEKSNIIKYIGISVTGGFILFFSYLLYARIRDRSVKIEISESGIKLFEENLLIPWTKISEIQIIRGKSSLSDLLVNYLVLTVETKTSLETKHISLEELNVDKNEVLVFSKSLIDKCFDKEKNEYCG